MKLDILAFGAHPDDVELSCGGTIIKYIKEGKRVGIVDLTRGELGTQGNETIRDSESSLSQSILGVEKRINLDIGDGWFEINKENKLKVVRAIRRYKPTIILANAEDDRHPDHPRAAQLLKESLFLSGLKKLRLLIMELFRIYGDLSIFSITYNIDI